MHLLSVCVLNYKINENITRLHWQILDEVDTVHSFRPNSIIFTLEKIINAFFLHLITINLDAISNSILFITEFPVSCLSYQSSALPIVNNYSYFPANNSEYKTVGQGSKFSSTVLVKTFDLYYFINTVQIKIAFKKVEDDIV